MRTLKVNIRDQLCTIKGDIHQGYFVEPGTKIPMVDFHHTYLSTMNMVYGIPSDSWDKDKNSAERLSEKLNNARTSQQALEELWKEGEILAYAHRDYSNKFNYQSFITKLTNLRFVKNPIDQALTFEERKQFLDKPELYKLLKNDPRIILAIIKSLSRNLDRKKEDPDHKKIVYFMIEYGTTKDLEDYLSLFPEHVRTSLSRNKDIINFIFQTLPKDWEEKVNLLKSASEPWQNYFFKVYGYEKTQSHFSEKVFFEILSEMKTASLIESNSNSVLHSLKLAILFNRTNQARDYIEKWTKSTRFGDHKQPVHDTLLFSLPNDQVDIESWRFLALKYGPEALNFFSRSIGIEQYLKERNAELKPDQQPLTLMNLTPQQLQRISKSFTYNRESENRKLAQLCATCGVSEENFEKGLAALAEVKKEDKMPEISIDGAAFDKEKYYMRKLSPIDPINLVIGDIVDCCSRLGGEGEKMAIAHVTSPTSACYVIFKQKNGKPNLNGDEIVAKTSAWLSQEGNFVFNSWERLKNYEHLCEPFLSAAAQYILDNNPKINRVLLGKNRDDIRSFIQIEDLENAVSIYDNTGDSQTQYLIAARKNKKRKALSRSTATEIKDGKSK